MKLGLDLGRIDVHAARNHHVLRAVAEIEEAVLVEIADIAERNEPRLLRLAALLVIAVIGEVRDGGGPAEDLAGRAMRELLAVFIDHHDLRAVDRLADGAGMGEVLLRIAEDDGARFRAAVILVDDGTPPFDHGLLDVNRAGRGGMNDEAERGEVVFLLHFVGQFQQAHEHGRYHVEMRDLVPFDHLQQFFRIEARLQDDVRADAESIEPVGIGRGVIHRAGDHGDHFLRLAIGGVEAHHLADDIGP